MTTKGVIIYDDTGRVWDILIGLETVPSGIQGIVSDIPSNYGSVYVNVTTKTAVFTPGENYSTEISNLQDVVLDLEARVSELEGGDD